MKNFFFIFLFIFFFITCDSCFSKSNNFFSSDLYIIKSVNFVNSKFLSNNYLFSDVKFYKGDVINFSEDFINYSIKKLLRNNIIENVNIYVLSVLNDKVVIFIDIKEKLRLNDYFFFGLSRNHKSCLYEKIYLNKGEIINDNLIFNIKKNIKNYFKLKGFFFVSVKIVPVINKDLNNFVMLKIFINKGKKFKINNIFISGNNNFDKNIILKKMINTKEIFKIKFFKAILKIFINNLFNEFLNFFSKIKKKKIKNYIYNNINYNIFSSFKFIKIKYDKDLINIIDFYHSIGFRDMFILKNILINSNNNKLLDVNINLHEGNNYFIKNIKWFGNYFCNDNVLNKLLKIKKGDLYDFNLIKQRLNSIIKYFYLNNGYLFFDITFFEKKVNHNSINLEFYIKEGFQSSINKIIIIGNNKTNNSVVLRQFCVFPGDKFNRANIIKSNKNIFRLNIFNSKNFGIFPFYNIFDNTIDVTYKLKEKSNDQIQITGGWSGGLGFIGSLEIFLNNFSFKNIVKFKNWNPMPIGDGQKVSLKISINSKTYQNYSFNFIESYLFGKKNNSLKINLLYSFNNSNDGILRTFGLIFGISKKLKLFNFVLNNHLSYFFYFYKNFKLIDNKKKFTGTSSNLNFSFSIISNNIDNFIYPKSGFFLNFSSKITPPYSLFKKEIMNFEKLIEFKNIEYHQWIISFSCFNKIFKNLVLNTKFFLGFLGKFSHNSHISPFERFYLGGNKMSYSRGFINSKFVSLRGYSDNSITPIGKYFGGILCNKFSLEFRYPIFLNKNTLSYFLIFIEGGNNWNNYQNFIFFNLKKSAGLGVRVFVPMLGLVGVDFGYGFNKDFIQNKVSGWQSAISIGSNLY